MNLFLKYIPQSESEFVPLFKFCPKIGNKQLNNILAETCTYVEKCNNFWWTCISIPYFSIGVKFTCKQKCMHSSWTLQEFTPTVKKRYRNPSPSKVVTFLYVGTCRWYILPIADYRLNLGCRQVKVVWCSEYSVAKYR